MGNVIGADTKFAEYLKTTEVDLPEYDSKLTLRKLNAGYYVRLDKQDPLFLFRYVAAMIVDESGNRIFVTEENVLNLVDLLPTAFDRLLIAANELNGTSPAAMEAAVKNSEPSPNGEPVSA